MTDFTISEVFHAITRLFSDLTIFPTKPGTNERNFQNLIASENLIKYLHKKSLCKELLSIPPLEIPEMNILSIIATGKLLSDNIGLSSLSNSVKQIQIILLSLIPPESKEYQKLLVEIPDLKRFIPQIG